MKRKVEKVAKEIAEGKCETRSPVNKKRKGRTAPKTGLKRLEKSSIVTRESQKSLPNRKKNKKKMVASPNSDVKIEENEEKVPEILAVKDSVLKKNENEPSAKSGVMKDKQTKSTKTRNPYTVFVGNLPFTATPEEVRKHFEKAGTVKDVRLPTDEKSSKRRGFGYVQLKDRCSYEKALTLHHTRILGRQINVEYTTQGKKGGPKEEKIKKKNLKLRALSKRGILSSVSRTRKSSKQQIVKKSEASKEIQPVAEKKKKKKIKTEEQC